MRATIDFGENFAILNAGEPTAMLTIDVTDLPVNLADELNNTDGISVTSVMRNDIGTPVIRIFHDLSIPDLLDYVSGTIAEVYDEDIRITR